MATQTKEQKDKCYHLAKALEKIYENRIKIQKKLRKKNYKKRGLGTFRKYLTTKEYLHIKYLHKKLVDEDKLPPNNLRHLVKHLLKFDCFNIYFREYYIGVKLIKKYKTLKDSSFYSYDKRVSFDNLTVGLIWEEEKTK